MRLLHTETLEFREFFDSQTPKYAILSHRWTGNEVSFEEYHHHKNQNGPSFSKIQNCSTFARKEGYQWVWIDTCCIDKRSSAELTEAINSMYAWYQKSAVCYAYLVDVVMLQDEHRKWNASREEFRQSAWFTRGWTLQELLAPNRIVFLDHGWRVIGSIDRGLKIDTSPEYPPSQGESLIDDISHATGINETDLYNSGGSTCVARKMSWLSRRETTRIEDMAYCVLGLCGVNMPLLYGEGDKAFKRLQLEIIKESDDETIFAWFCDRNGNAMTNISGILATSPGNFAQSAQVEKALERRGTRPYSMTNKGLQYYISRYIGPRSMLDRYSDNREPRYGTWDTHEPQYGNWDTSDLSLDCSVVGGPQSLVGTSVRIDLVYYMFSWWRDWRRSEQPRLGDPMGEGPSFSFETIYLFTGPDRGPYSGSPVQ
ncbi:MAG: hypothetical protein Q9207_006269 [Kuettlingeria erythrocarpa]